MNLDIVTILNTELRLMTVRQGDKQINMYKGSSSKQITPTLKTKINEFFDKYMGTNVTENIQIKPDNIKNIIPMRITPSAVSNFYNSLVHSYSVDIKQKDLNRRPIFKPFDEIFSLDDIDLLLSFGLEIGKKYLFKIPTKVSNDKIYIVIKEFINKNYGFYEPLFKWFDNELQKATSAEQAKAGQIDMANITGDSSILPFLGSEMGSGLSGATYSFIEEDKNDLMNQNYSFLQERDINKMPEYTRHDAPSSLNGGGGHPQLAAMNRKTGGATDNAYEAMMKARGSEMQQRAPPQTPNFSSPY